MNEDNISQESMLEIAKNQNTLYKQRVEGIMINKRVFLDRPKQYETELFTLDKIIKRNKRLGNGYAVIRDEVLEKSYKLIRSQNKMVRNILRALDYYDLKAYEQATADLFLKNQIEIQELMSVDYHPVLKLEKASVTLKEAQKNIKDFYTLLEINADTLTHIADIEKSMYRLNHYSRYGLIKPILAINNTNFAKSINPHLSPYGFNIVKILLILLVFLLIYLIRKVFFIVLEKFLLSISYFTKYANEILVHIRKPIDIVLILINIELAIYIYNDFNHYALASKFFNIVYAFFFTLIVYQVLNTVASIKLHDLEHSDKKIKNEMVNVGIKIINFLIMILGLLLILHFAGANLTAVLSGLGIGGFAVAIAARDSLSNFIGTISILLSDTFSQGDWIEIEGKQGTVVEIGLRVTTVRTFDNALIAIPNATLANHDVKNWSKRSIGRRIKMNIGLKYTSKAKDIRNAVTQIRQMLQQHPDLATEKTNYNRTLQNSSRLVSEEDDLGIKRTLLVYLDELSDSSINILVYCFSKTTDWNEWLKIKEDVIYKIMDILEENSLEFAFPSLSLYHENELEDNND
ncbi:mechanosensitive ion channel family protein [Sulfurovum sp.]|uniref:mechanosensitive ion channel family protein n=1 Tax=Sulfurovum sp. TaxID=1969726 RepID=UPI002867B264|nr:mechanosensitive ion channel family protein [Sulfurovum sp.]